MSLPSNLSELTQADLEQLVRVQTQEGPHLDFKRELPAQWDTAAKHEFLADVSAFANASGGDLIYGIEEDGNGQASAVVPQTINADQEVRRLQDFLLNLVEPRLPGLQVVAIPVDVNGAIGYVLVVRVPQSWAGPHRVKTNQHFFLREGLRKRQLDVPEIRGLFLRSENQVKRILDFRTERLGKILSGEAPHRLVNRPVLVVHIVPTQAALGLVQVDPVQYKTQRSIPVVGATVGAARMNVDGALAVRDPGPEGTHGYTQLFRNGFLESVKVLGAGQDGQHALLPSLRYEQELNTFLQAVRVEFVHLGVSTELAVMLSILRANEVQLGVRHDLDFIEPHQGFFDRKTLVLPDVLTQGDMPAELAMKPVFDLVWQSAGFRGSRNYNAEGQWTPQR
jgi:hypothetical protein